MTNSWRNVFSVKQLLFQMLLFIVLFNITPPYQFQVAFILVSTVNYKIENIENGIWILENCSVAEGGWYLIKDRYCSIFDDAQSKYHSIMLIQEFTEIIPSSFLRINLESHFYKMRSKMKFKRDLKKE